MRNVVDTQVIGTQHISLNCQALSGPATLLSVNAVGGPADAAKAGDKKADDKKADAKKDGDKKDGDKKGTESSKAAPSTDASGMEVLDEDP
ncbi:MAG: hypothetical protein U1U88_001639 [Lawsonella clevelandensis]